MKDFEYTAEELQDIEKLLRPKPAIDVFVYPTFCLDRLSVARKLRLCPITQDFDLPSQLGAGEIRIHRQRRQSSGFLKENE